MKKVFLMVMIILAFLLFFNLNVSANESKKLESFKTKNREFICNNDGTYTDRYYATAINFYENGEYKKINNVFTKTQDGYTNQESNYKIFLPDELSKENKIVLDYYDYNLAFSFSNMNDKMSSKVFKKSKGDKERLDFAYSEKLIYCNENYEVIVDNYTDNLKLSINSHSVNALFNLKLDISSNKLSYIEKEDVISVVNNYNSVIYEINRNYTLKTGTNTYNRKLMISDDGVLEFEKEALVFDSTASLELQVLYTLNRDSGCITDKHVISGIDYSYDEEYLRVGKNETTEYKAIVSIDVSLLNTDLDISDVSLVYFKESGANKRLNVYMIEDEMYSDITGLTTYSKKFIDSTTYSNGYNFNLTYAFLDEPEPENNKYLFEISMALGASGIQWLSSDNGYEIPYLEINYEEMPETDYGAALPFTSITSGNMNCFGYALNVNEFIQLTDENGTRIFISSNIVNEGDFQTIYIPVMLSIIERYGFSARLLVDYDSPIYEDEYRIAFRMGNINTLSVPSNNDFHFLRQNNDGTWSHKQGRAVSENLTNITNPASYSWPLLHISSSGVSTQDSNFYNTSICYVAVGSNN